jgi:hypothetical protein
VAVL